MNINALEKTALSIRALTMDACQKANSGHPGLPMGAAELGAILYGEIMRHDPSATDWPDRDRFVLSAGHGSMFLYSILHMAGYKDASMEALKNFRQLGSKAAGHPEYGLLKGIEATSGPLGQGVSMSVGMAIAETMLAARFNTAKQKIVDHYTYALVGDGCLMEGVSAEASSLAGHLQLGKLIVFYDSNKITIDGSTDIAFTEDVAKRYEAYGWQVLKGSMYDFNEIASLVEKAKAEGGKPSLIILKSIIGKGSPHKQNTAGIHGSPLGAEEVAAAKEALGIPAGEAGEFYVAPEAKAYFAEKAPLWQKEKAAWDALFADWSKENPDLRKTWDAFYAGGFDNAGAALPEYKIGDSIATRAAGNKALQALSLVWKNLVGGAADLKTPNAVGLPDSEGTYTPEARVGRYIHFGIREFAMACICNGISLHGGLRAFCATFMVFADYLRPALRLSALMNQPVVYVLTHDSIYVGEDGPTHQPVEHLASLRAIPNVLVLRPADGEESTEAWEMALERKDGPTCLCLSRQNLKVFEKQCPVWKKNMRKGAYVALDTRKVDDKGDSNEHLDVIIIGTGSEVGLALDAAHLLQAKGKSVRVVSMPSRETFETQDAAFRNKILPKADKVLVAEAGIRQGWEAFTSVENILCMKSFGESGPAGKVAEHFGFSPEALAAMV
ncbi:MAG: transketolase [Spirochaetaceae bacterium]|jgi:transketolase|nr:transketolase [Spirochaetaceae bacterium]